MRATTGYALRSIWHQKGPAASIVLRRPPPVGPVPSPTRAAAPAAPLGLDSSGGSSTAWRDLSSLSGHAARAPEMSPWQSSQRAEVVPSQVAALSYCTAAAPEDLKVERLQGSDAGVVVLSLDRPAARNAIGDVLLRQLEHAVGALRFDLSARVLIVRSLVDGVFCAGADLKERRKKSAAEVQQYVQRLRAAYTALEALPVPSVAAIEGSALGGGLELALSCDLRVAGSGAIFGLPETSLAIIPGAGGTQRLPRAVGRARAKELILTARRIGTLEAEEYGLVEHAVPGGQAFEKALSIAREILPRGPVAIRMAKTAVDRGADVDATSALAIEEACYAQLLPTKDRLEGLVAFAEKRSPVYRGE